MRSSLRTARKCAQLLPNSKRSPLATSAACSWRLELVERAMAKLTCLPRVDSEDETVAGRVELSEEIWRVPEDQQGNPNLATAQDGVRFGQRFDCGGIVAAEERLPPFVQPANRFEVGAAAGDNGGFGR